MTEKGQDLIRRRFIGKLVKLGSLAGITGLAAGRLADPGIISSARAEDGQPLIIGGYNEGNSKTTLEAAVTDSWPRGGPVLVVRNMATEIPVGSQGTAVEGVSVATSGESMGVAGFTFSPEGQGVHGHALGETGNNVGVAGVSDSPDGVGVHGHALSTSGMCVGIMGKSESWDGTGVKGIGVREGIRGDATETTDNAIGVHGFSYSTYDGSAGVVGHAFGPTGGNIGVAGYSDLSPSGRGVHGHALSPTGYTIGVSGTSSSPDGVGVNGRATSPTGGTIAVNGRSDSPDGVGVRGYAAAESGVNRGVVGRCNSPDGVGVAGNNTGGGLDMVLWGSGIAGYAPRTTDPPAREQWQFYIFNTKDNKFELRILGPSGHVNKVCELKP